MYSFEVTNLYVGGNSFPIVSEPRKLVCSNKPLPNLVIDLALLGIGMHINLTPIRSVNSFAGRQPEHHFVSS